MSINDEKCSSNSRHVCFLANDDRRWANARVSIEEQDGVQWVVKDYSHSPFLFKYSVAKCILWNELRILRRLHDVGNTPDDVREYGKFGLRYRYVLGMTLSDMAKSGKPVDASFCPALEQLVQDMHAAGVVHLDLRVRRNILVRDDGKPSLIDFQTALIVDHFPGIIRRLFRKIDISGVYKHWNLRNPGTMGRERILMFHKMQRLRRLWLIRGYPIKNLRGRLASWMSKTAAVKKSS